MPEPFTDAELNDTSNEFVQEAKRKLGSRLDADYIGVTCDGEVRLQESCDAIAMMTAQCALYMGALKIFGTP